MNLKNYIIAKSINYLDDHKYSQINTVDNFLQNIKDDFKSFGLKARYKRTPTIYQPSSTEDKLYKLFIYTTINNDVAICLFANDSMIASKQFSNPRVLPNKTMWFTD